jgi:hypothetical protein
VIELLLALLLRSPMECGWKHLDQGYSRVGKARARFDSWPGAWKAAPDAQLAVWSIADARLGTWHHAPVLPAARRVASNTPTGTRSPPSSTLQGPRSRSHQGPVEATCETRGGCFYPVKGISSRWWWWCLEVPVTPAGRRLLWRRWWWPLAAGRACTFAATGLPAHPTVVASARDVLKTIANAIKASASRAAFRIRCDEPPAAGDCTNSAPFETPTLLTLPERPILGSPHGFGLGARDVRAVGRSRESFEASSHLHVVEQHGCDVGSLMR